MNEPLKRAKWKKPVTKDHIMIQCIWNVQKREIYEIENKLVVTWLGVEGEGVES